MNRRELIAAIIAVPAAGIAGMAISKDNPTYPVEQPITTEILNAHLANPNEGDMLTVISDGKEWHIV